MSDSWNLARTCNDFRRQTDRRGFLKVGLLGTAGLSLSQLLRHEAQAAAAAKRNNAGLAPDENVMPSCGSIVAEQLGHKNPELPPYVIIPRMLPGAGAAHLGVAYKPFETGADPAAPGPFKLPNFQIAEGLSVDRLG